MNFVGHARIASFFRDDGAFVVGAMLPDFARMAGTRIRTVEDPDLAAGVQHHHAADDVFHAQPAFIRLQVTTRNALSAAGVPRPPALAVGHVGVELLLDGALLRDEALSDLYLSALDQAPRAIESVTWRGIDGRANYAQLCDRLLDRGAPHVYRDPAAVAEIMQRILSRSALLRLESACLPAVRTILEQMLPRVQDAADGLLHAVRVALENDTPRA